MKKPLFTLLCLPMIGQQICDFSTNSVNSCMYNENTVLLKQKSILKEW